MGSTLRMNPLNTILGQRGLLKGGKVQRYVDSEVLRLTDPYVPMQDSMLKKSGILGTDIGSGEVVYKSPYAKYLYYGKVMIGKAPKTLTEKDLTYHGAPKRGAFWFEQAKANHKREIIEGAAKIAGGVARW